jgi:hypothetical protein
MATAKMYGNFLLKALNKEVTLGNGATGLKCMLTTSLYTPNQDTDIYKSSVTNECTGTNYTAGGAALTSVTVAYTAGTNTITVDAADTTWATSTIAAARYAVIYDSTPATDATRPLICYVDFTTDQSSSSGSFTITWDATGIFTITTA